MKTPLTFLIILHALISFSQPSFNWDTAPDTLTSAYSRSLFTDTEGNIYTFGNINATSNNIYTKYTKLDQYGQLLWEKVDSGVVNGVAISDALLGEDGFIYTCGSYKNTQGGYDAFLSKYDKDGNLQWQQFYNSPIDSIAQARTLMYFNHEVYIGGSAIGSSLNYEAFLAKYDTLGNQIWTVIDDCGSPGPDGIHSINNDGTDIIVSGNCNFNGFFSSNFLLIKYNVSGLEQWREQIDFGNLNWGFNTGMSIAIDNLQDIYVTLHPNSYYYDLVKYSSNGLFLWGANAAPTIPNNPASYNKIKINEEGHIYLSGTAGIVGGIDGLPAFLFTRIDKDGNTLFNYPGTWVGGNWDFQFRNSNEMITLGPVDSMGHQILCFDSTGTVLWDIRYQADVSPSQCDLLSIDSLGNVIIAGYLLDTVSNYTTSFYTIKYGSILFLDVHSIPLSTEQLAKFDIFPNPSEGLFTIRSKEHLPTSLRILNNLGTEVYSTSTQATETLIDIHHLPVGTYWLEMSSEGRKTMHKLVKL